MKLIDFHTHIYPDMIAETATKNVGEFYDIPPESVGTVSNLLELEKKAGVSRSVMLPVACKSTHVEHLNSYARELGDKYEEIIPFGTMHAGYENKINEAGRITELGLKGVKIHPDNQLFNIDDERMFEFYDYIQGKLPLIVHTGDPRYDYSHPRRLKRIMHLFPRLICIGAHFGGWGITEEAKEILVGEENCFVDLSSSFRFIGLEKGEEYIKAYSPDRVLFGSDFPIGSPVIERENLLRLHISDDDREKIAYKNAEKLLEIKI